MDTVSDCNQTERTRRTPYAPGIDTADGVAAPVPPLTLI